MKKLKTEPEKLLRLYRRRLRFLFTVFVLFAAAAGVFIYINYDYLAFKYFISGHYIYTDALDELYNQRLKRNVEGRYYAYFDNVAISLFTEAIRDRNNDGYTYMYLPERLSEYLDSEKREALESYTRHVDENTVYLRITNFSKYTWDFVKHNVNNLKQYSDIILDLRGNSGGDIKAMQKISGLFLPKGDVIAVDEMRFITWTYKSHKKPVFSFDNIVILQDGNTASASENMIVALNDNLKNVLLVGSRTYGKGIGQYTLSLRRGFAVKATTLLWYTPDGINIHKAGIEPEVEYSGKDAVEFVKALLEEKS